LEQKYFDIVLEELRPFLAEQGFKTGKAESKGEEALSARFASAERVVSVRFNEDSSQIELRYCDAEADKDEEKLLSAWLFDTEHGERDAKHIAIDYLDSLKEQMGLKETKRRSATDVALPSKGTPGDTPNIDAFCARFLAICPQYKDDYKEHVLTYGELLYEDFFRRTAVPYLKTILDEGNKKTLIKFFDFLNEMYAAGDKTVGAVITGVIVAGGFDGDVKRFDGCAAYMENAKYLKQRGRSVVSQTAADKKWAPLYFWRKKD